MDEKLEGLVDQAITSGDKFYLGIIGDYLEERPNQDVVKYVRKSKDIWEVLWYLQNENVAFVTGSCAYGTPTSDSDIDLVVLLPRIDVSTICEFLEDEFINDRQSNSFRCTNRSSEYPGISLRFGKLNLIIVQDIQEWKIWKEGTSYLKSIRPVTRDKAVEKFKELRSKMSENA